MTKKLILASLAICVFTVGSLTANAYQGHGGGYGSRDMESSESYDAGCRKQNKGPQREMMAEVLGLTEEQQEKIEAIRQAARTNNETLRETMQGYREQLQELTKNGNFDEEAVRVLAEKKAEIQVELAVSKVRTHSEIFAIMTPEQQELAEKLRSARHNNRGKHQRGHGSRW